MRGQDLTYIRPSLIAGQWYPGTADSLSEAIRHYLEAAEKAAISGKIVGLIAPHAGYVYSGGIAAHAFCLVQDHSFDRVVIVCPKHSYHPGAILTTAYEAYNTPLGTIPVDIELLATLKSKVNIESVRHDEEHALEIELPFLQHALHGDFSLLPLMLRDQTYACAEMLGKALAAVIGGDKGTLLIASSDLSHFYTDTEARRLDRVMLDRIEAFDPQGVIQIEEEGRAYACGRAAIAAVLVAARELGATKAQIVGYGTSGDTGGDRSRVVGYGAGVIYIED